MTGKPAIGVSGHTSTGGGLLVIGGASMHGGAVWKCDHHKTFVMPRLTAAIVSQLSQNC